MPGGRDGVAESTVVEEMKRSRARRAGRRSGIDRRVEMKRSRARRAGRRSGIDRGGGAWARSLPGAGRRRGIDPFWSFSSDAHEERALLTPMAAPVSYDAAVRVLVVEDEVKMAALVKRALEREGYAVDLAATGDDGLWLASENDYDAVVLDVMIPPPNGFEVCRGCAPEAGGRPC